MAPIKIGFFDCKPYDQQSFSEQIEALGVKDQFHFTFISDSLSPANVDQYLHQFQAVCCFVNCTINAHVIKQLKTGGVEIVLLRCAGFDMIDLSVCKEVNMSVARVPAYSPYAVAEFAAGTLMTLNRKIHKAFNRVRDSNFTLNGLVGSDLYGKTVGIIGTGKIGRCFADIAIGFGCKILAYDVFISEELKALPQVKYVTLEDIFKHSDYISLHAPLTAETTHIINEKSLSLMKPHCIIINTSRGKLIDTKALLQSLVSQKIGGAALDVYENEKKYFFNDFSHKEVDDDVLARLQNMNNVIVTSHQAFLTYEALEAIAKTTLINCQEFFIGGKRLSDMTNAVV